MNIFLMGAAIIVLGVIVWYLMTKRERGAFSPPSIHPSSPEMPKEGGPEEGPTA